MTYIQTYSGNKFDYTTYTEDDFYIEDIAHSLSRTCRFNGHCEDFYSVAEHCYLMSYLVDLEHAKEALLHDASEAYIGDIPSPLKKFIKDAIVPIEDKIIETVFNKYGLTFPFSEQVKNADLEMLYWEYQLYIRKSSEVRWDTLEGLSFPIERKPNFKSWTPQQAKEKFLERFNELF